MCPQIRGGTGGFATAPQQDTGTGAPRRMSRGAIPTPQRDAVSPCPLGWAWAWWHPKPGRAYRRSGTLPADATSGAVAMAVADAGTAGLAQPPRCWHCHAVSAGLGTGSRALARGGRSGAAAGGIVAGAIAAGAMAVGSHRPPAHAKLRTHAPGWLQWAGGTGEVLGQDARGGHPIQHPQSRHPSGYEDALAQGGLCAWSPGPGSASPGG